jgi:hypothetical protein
MLSVIDLLDKVEKQAPSPNIDLNKCHGSKGQEKAIEKVDKVINDKLDAYSDICEKLVRVSKVILHLAGETTLSHPKDAEIVAEFDLDDYRIFEVGPSPAGFLDVLARVFSPLHSALRCVVMFAGDITAHRIHGIKRNGETSDIRYESGLLGGPIPPKGLGFPAAHRKKLVTYLKSTNFVWAIDGAVPLLTKIMVFHAENRAKMYSDVPFTDCLVCLAYDLVRLNDGLWLTASLSTMDRGFVNSFGSMFELLSVIAAERGKAWLKHFEDPTRLTRALLLVYAPPQAGIPPDYRPLIDYVTSSENLPVSTKF